MTYQMTSQDMTNEQWISLGFLEALKGLFLGGINCLLCLIFCMATSLIESIFTDTFHAYYGAISISFFFGFGCIWGLEIKRFEMFLGGYAWSFLFILAFFINDFHFTLIAVCSALAALMGYGLFSAISWIGYKAGKLFLLWRE